jgi:hypothetical protein
VSKRHKRRFMRLLKERALLEASERARQISDEAERLGLARSENRHLTVKTPGVVRRRREAGTKRTGQTDGQMHEEAEARDAEKARRDREARRSWAEKLAKEKRKRRPPTED